MLIFIYQDMVKVITNFPSREFLIYLWVYEHETAVLIEFLF